MSKITKTVTAQYFSGQRNIAPGESNDPDLAEVLIEVQAAADDADAGVVARKAVDDTMTPYDAAADETIIGVDTSAGAVTVNLPDATLCKPGKRCYVNDEGGNAGTLAITMGTQGGQTVDGGAPAAISANYGSQGYYTDGANWFTL